MITIFLSIFLPTGYVSEFQELNISGFPPIILTQTSAERQLYAGSSVKTSKVYKRTTRYNSLGMTKKDLNCYDDSNACGEYFSLDSDLWEEASFSIDEHKRINVGRSQAGENVRIFILKDFEIFLHEMLDEGMTYEQIKELYNDLKEPTITDDLIGFNRRVWSELRRVRGENRGRPLEVNANGTIWVGDRAGQGELKIFIPRG